MDGIRVKREEILTALKENRKTHVAEFDLAIKVWRKKCKKALAKALKRAEKDGFIDLNLFGDLPKPVSYKDSYDNAIARMEFEVRDEVELDDREFSAWVQDNWTWRGAFVANSTMYTGSL